MARGSMIKGSTCQYPCEVFFKTLNLVGTCPDKKKPETPWNTWHYVL